MLTDLKSSEQITAGNNQTEGWPAPLLLQKLCVIGLATLLSGTLLQASAQALEHGATPACLLQYDGTCSQNAVPPMPQMREIILKVSASGNVARDGNIAIQEEFDAAMLANSFAAWELFIRRHPDHPLVEAAWGELRKLLNDKDGD